MTQFQQDTMQTIDDVDLAARESDLPGPTVNVNDNERLVSGAAGAVLALVGISRRSIPGILMAGIGGGLLYRAATGHCHVYDALGIDTNQRNAEADGAPP